MSPAILGTKTGLAGIPGLQVSTLGQVQDPATRRAIYEIQNWANSVGLVNGTTGIKTATLGTNYPGVTTTPATWTTVSLNGVAAYIPVWT